MIKVPPLALTGSHRRTVFGVPRSTLCVLMFHGANCVCNLPQSHISLPFSLGLLPTGAGHMLDRSVSIGLYHGCIALLF